MEAPVRPAGHVQQLPGTPRRTTRPASGSSQRASRTRQRTRPPAASRAASRGARATGWARARSRATPTDTAGAASGHVLPRSERDVTAHLEEHQSASGGLPEVEDEACAVAPSERQARSGGRATSPPSYSIARAQCRANEPAAASEQDRRSDAVGGAREIGTAVGFDHAVPGPAGQVARMHLPIPGGRRIVGRIMTTLSVVRSYGASRPRSVLGRASSAGTVLSRPRILSRRWICVLRRSGASACTERAP